MGVYAYNWIFFSNKNEQTIDTHNNMMALKNMLSKRSGTPASTHYMILFIWSPKTGVMIKAHWGRRGVGGACLLVDGQGDGGWEKYSLSFYGW